MGISLGQLLGLGGKPQNPPDDWETFSNWQISGDWDLAEWEPIIDRAESMGLKIERKDGTVYMWKSDNCNGRFMTAKGGHKLAEQFLDGIGGRR